MMADDGLDVGGGQPIRENRIDVRHGAGVDHRVGLELRVVHGDELAARNTHGHGRDIDIPIVVVEQLPVGIDGADAENSVADPETFLMRAMFDPDSVVGSHPVS
ncbi:MAG: hypothetical protein OXD35_00545, partial [Thiotrichales bacterium]|nr:hypothetical protein [Thiotrichales bacterium]